MAGPSARRVAVLSDFDGTITRMDVAEAILARFAPPEWWEIEELHRARRLGTRETMARQFALLRGDPGPWIDFVHREARMDPAFPSFLRFCREHGFPLEIVSEGLDFYVYDLMKMWSLDVPVRTNRAVFDGGPVRIEYPFAEPGCTLCGTCKLRRLFELRVAGHRVVYIGDGDSDLCPAVEADVVFAKERLAELCDSESIPYHPFGTFADIGREHRADRGPPRGTDRPRELRRGGLPAGVPGGPGGGRGRPHGPPRRGGRADAHRVDLLGPQGQPGRDRGPGADEARREVLAPSSHGGVLRGRAHRDGPPRVLLEDRRARPEGGEADRVRPLAGNPLRLHARRVPGSPREGGPLLRERGGGEAGLVVRPPEATAGPARLGGRRRHHPRREGQHDPLGRGDARGPRGPVPQGGRRDGCRGRVPRGVLRGPVAEARPVPLRPDRRYRRGLRDREAGHADEHPDVGKGRREGLPLCIV